MSFKPTHQQQAIIDFAGSGESFVVNALAGTGKTTTLKQVCLAYPERQFLYVAFNNTVAKDFADWVAEEGITNVVSKTGDAVARSYVQNVYYKPYGLDIGKRIGSGITRSRDIVELFNFKSLTLSKRKPGSKNGIEEPSMAKLTMRELVSYLKDGLEKFSISADESLLDKHFEKYIPTPTVFEYALELWEDYNNPEDGQLHLPFWAIYKIFALDSPTMKYSYNPAEDKVFDTLLIDEAQDTNPVAGVQYRRQADMQIIYVGDPNQAIYGFRGAEDEMQKRTDLQTLPLTESWRFGENIAEFANNVLNKLESKNYLQGNSPYSGEVKFGVLQEPDAIIQRTNSGCFMAILYLLNTGMRPMVDPKTKQELVSLTESLGYLAGLSSAPYKISEELQDYDSIAAVEEALEKRDLPLRIKMILEIVEDSKRGPDYLLDLLKPLSLRGHKGVRVITTHRAKGDEWDNVQLGGDFFTPRWDKEEKQVIMPHPSELMLIYVAATRAQKTLSYNHSTKWVLMSEEEIYDDLYRRYELNEEANC